MKSRRALLRKLLAGYKFVNALLNDDLTASSSTMFNAIEASADPLHDLKGVIAALFSEVAARGTMSARQKLRERMSHAGLDKQPMRGKDWRMFVVVSDYCLEGFEFKDEYKHGADDGTQLVELFGLIAHMSRILYGRNSFQRNRVVILRYAILSLKIP